MISFLKDNFIFFIIVLVIAYFYFTNNSKEHFTMLYQNPIPDAFGIQHCVPKFDQTIGEYKFEKYCENPKNNPQSIPKNLNINQLSTIILKGPIDTKNGQIFNLDMIKYGGLPGGNYMYANRDSTNFGDIPNGFMTANVKQCLNNPPQGALGFSYAEGICYFKNKFNLQPKQNINTFVFNRTIQYSISLWIKIADRNNPEAWNNIFSIRNSSDTFRIPSIFIEPNSTSMQFASATTLNNIFLTKPTQGLQPYSQESTSIDKAFIPEQTWNHVIFTIQGNQISGYVNGKNVLSSTFEGFPLDNNSFGNNDPIQLYIGANNMYPQSGGIIIQDVTWYPIALPQDYITAYLWPNINKPSDQNVATAVQFTSANNTPLSISRVNVFDITGKNISQNQMVWSSPGIQGSVPVTNITMADNIGWWTGTNNPSVSVSLGGNSYTIGKVELIVEILKSWSNNNPQVYNQTAQNIINQFKNNQIRLHNSGKSGQALSGVAPATWTNWTTIENSMIQPIQDTGKSLIVKAIIDYSGGFADTSNNNTFSNNYNAYVWSESDEAYLKQNGYSDASQKARCESYGYIFTRGNNESYPGCGGGWCCKRTN